MIIDHPMTPSRDQRPDRLGEVHPVNQAEIMTHWLITVTPSEKLTDK